jgi:predicted TIM-barrel fold metal-dependent hydrolase
MLAFACQEPEVAVPEPSVPPPPASAAKSTPATPGRERIDVHMHLLDRSVDELLAALDRGGISRAVVLASPHLDPAHPSAPGDDRFAGWRAANERLLIQTVEHRDRLLPFITVDPAQIEAGELGGWLARGACGVKLYIGHRNLHHRPLADPSHDDFFAELERRRVPVLLHVNTVHFEDELGALLAAHPRIELVCPHLCGSRTDLDRLERLLRTHPGLRVDTSHGPGEPGIAGFANLEREHARARGMIQAEPERFLFGSDLVTTAAINGPDATRREWDRQIAANLGLLEDDRFEFWRAGPQPGVPVLGDYRGLALEDSALGLVLAGNARRWLERCLP